LRDILLLVAPATAKKWLAQLDAAEDVIRARDQEIAQLKAQVATLNEERICRNGDTSYGQALEIIDWSALPRSIDVTR
jgi:hypothetical protein